MCRTYGYLHTEPLMELSRYVRIRIHIYKPIRSRCIISLQPYRVQSIRIFTKFFLFLSHVLFTCIVHVHIRMISIYLSMYNISIVLPRQLNTIKNLCYILRAPLSARAPLPIPHLHPLAQPLHSSLDFIWFRLCNVKNKIKMGIEVRGRSEKKTLHYAN